MDEDKHDYSELNDGNDPVERSEEEQIEYDRAKERLNKLRNLTISGNAADPNTEFETVPAYIRRNMQLYAESADAEKFYSNYEVKSDLKTTHIPILGTNSLSLLFPLDEYKPEEIAEVIDDLSALYTEAGGDRLIIQTISTIQLVPIENPVVV